VAAKADEPWTIKRLLEWTTQFLAGKDAESPRLDAEVLLAHALGCKRIEVYMRFEEIAPEDARLRYRDLVKQRAEGCPVAYLVGRKEFFSLELEVSPAVLIPRPDTEHVVQEYLVLAKELSEPTVLDLGTGSGNLAVAVAKHHKGARVTAVDLSPDALALAQRNAAKHGVAERITFLQGDLFVPLATDNRFDFVLSNPPYIPHGDIASLAPGVRDYEPHRALDGGTDGFAVFERIVSGARDWLKPGGHLILEIGSPQEGPARERIQALAGYQLAPTLRDGAGHPRVLRARWSPAR